MSDVILGALLAGLSGLFGVLIGGAIASVNSWIQIKSKTREAEISRRIKSRETYLISLRESLSKYLSISMKGYKAYGVFREMQAQGVEAKDSSTAFKTVTDTLDASGQIMEQIEALSMQSPNEELHRMILDIKNKQLEVEIILRNEAKWLANTKNIPSNEWNDRLLKLNTVISKQSQILIPINKRIESLLSGFV